MSFTKRDLRAIYGHLSSLLPPGAKPLTADQIVEVSALLEKTRAEIETSLGAIERGPLVFSWRVDPEIAPTMNEWGFWQPWRKGKARRELEKAIHEIIASTPNALVRGSEVMRWVRVTRYTVQPKNVDDAAIDAIGGKMPIDMLVKLGVLAGDSPRYLKREARVEKTGRGNTHVLVEVFEVASEEVPAAPPADDIPAPPARQYGPLTQAILGEGTGPSKPPRVLPFGDDS